MNKKQYLDALEKELSLLHVNDIGEVLADYEAHFARKAADGYTEEETARRLGDPREIAADFQPVSQASKDEGTAKTLWIPRCALCLLDLAMIPFFAVLYLWAIAVLLGAVGALALGGYVALGMTSLSFIPVLPAIGGALMGLCIVMVAVMLGLASLWSFMLASQMSRSYGRWHGNRWNARHDLPLPVTPQMTGKLRRTVRAAVIAALVCFVVLFAAAYIALWLQAGTPGFWHAWHWFS